MPLLVKFFALAFSALLPLINPLGSALVFLGIVGDAPAKVYRDLARRIAINTTLFLVAIELVGTAILSFFGISLPVVQVSGGIVLAAMGWNLLNQGEPEVKREQEQLGTAKFDAWHQKVFYPFTFPITAGPGTIVVMLTLSAHASIKGVLPDIMAHVGIILAVVVLSGCVLLSYSYAPKITTRIPLQTAHGIRRVIAFVLLCIGVQITWNGLESMLRTLFRL
jgi:multiple antibiotic resistance protein